MKPRILDLFCCQGGASMGLYQAGFRVVGMDIEWQPRYPFDFIKHDIMQDELPIFDAYWASPPCQKWSKSSKQWRVSGKKYEDLIGKVRLKLLRTGKPYVIENVPNAPLYHPIVLNGPYFGMNILRTRWFECSFPVDQPLLPKDRKPVKMGRPIKKGDVVQPVGHFSGVEYARQEMGIDWMNQYGLSQAIPPAYARYIGEFLIKYLGLGRR